MTTTVDHAARLGAVHDAIEAAENLLLAEPNREASKALCEELLRHTMYLMGTAQQLETPHEQARYLAGVLMTWVENSMPYDAYLQTEHWRRVRMEALDRAEHRCMVCYGPDNLEVHHRHYQNLWHERTADLTVLCADCHARHHGTGR